MAAPRASGAARYGAAYDKGKVRPLAAASERNGRSGGRLAWDMNPAVPQPQELHRLLKFDVEALQSVCACKARGALRRRAGVRGCRGALALMPRDAPRGGSARATPRDASASVGVFTPPPPHLAMVRAAPAQHRSAPTDACTAVITHTVKSRRCAAGAHVGAGLGCSELL